MAERFADILAFTFQAYALLGLVFAGPFVVRGVDRIDPLARGASWLFRLLIIPGVMAWWPLLLYRWMTGRVTPPIEVNAHRRRARGQS